MKVAHVCIYNIDDDVYRNRLYANGATYLFETPIAITSSDQIPAQMAQVREAVDFEEIEFRSFTFEEVNAGELGEWLNDGP